MSCDASSSHGDSASVIESYLYTYLESGPNAGRLAHVTLRRRVGQGDWQDVRRVAYSYYGGGDSGGSSSSGDPDPGDLLYGSVGDLKTATQQHRWDEDWLDGEVHYYRYYTGGEPGGFAHGLKYVLGPQAFARLEEDPEVFDPFEADDQTVARYADYHFEYNGQWQVSKEAVAGGRQVRTFSYTEGTQ